VLVHDGVRAYIKDTLIYEHAKGKFGKQKKMKQKGKGNLFGQLNI
jgi:hypothetical protein